MSDHNKGASKRENNSQDKDAYEYNTGDNMLAIDLNIWKINELRVFLKKRKHPIVGMKTTLINQILMTMNIEDTVKVT